MKQPKPGGHLIVRQGVHEYDATVQEIKPDGCIVCKVQKPDTLVVMTFRTNGHGHHGARLQKTRTVGVRVAGAVE